MDDHPNLRAPMLRQIFPRAPLTRGAFMPLAPMLVALIFLPACSQESPVPGSEAASPSAPLGTSDLPVCASLTDPAPGSCVFATTGFYTSKEPYAPRQLPGSYATPPEGFRAVMVQHVARHGSRALSSPDDDDLMYQLWEQAGDEGARTPLGELLGPVLEDILRVHQVVGYGLTSRLGELEHERTAARLLERHPELFDSIVSQRRRIDVFHSGRERADESGEAFVRGLTAGMPALTDLFEPARASVETLYFNEAEGSESYQEYSDNDPRMLAAVETIEEDPRTRVMARLMLMQLFSEDFVDRLASGAWAFAAAADPDDTIEDELDAAEALYGLYSIAVGLTEEAQWDLGRFVHPEAVAWFAYVDDAGSFYDRGPGFSDEDITYAAARTLVADMFGRIDAFVAGEDVPPVTVRFSHAQALMPVAAFLGIRGSSEETHPDTLYTYENNPWRSELVSPMAANVQWDVFQNEAGTVVVRMLHQEGEVEFAPNCRPVEGARLFYELGELKRCYGF